ncbi:TonB-dependent receptor [Phocaeicola sp.]
MKKIAVIAFAGILPFSAVYAQQDSTLNRTVVVENEYNPTVMDASKINVLPKVEEPAVVKKGIEYATALRPVVAWSYEEMSPIVREWTAENVTRGYLRGGYGNYGNVDFKAGYVWDMTKKDRLQVGALLDGWNGTLKDLTDNDWKSRFYSSAFNIGYRHSFSKLDLSVGGGVNSQVFNYMPSPVSSVAEENDKQHHTLGNFRVGLASTDEMLPLQFTVETGFEYFKQKYPTYITGNETAMTEKLVHTVGDVWGRLNEVQRVGIKFEMDNLFYSGSRIDNYTSLCLNPYYAIDEDNWRLRLGAHVDWLTGGEDSGIDVAPDVKAEFIFSDSYVLYLHAQGGRQVNDFCRLNGISPYWAPSSLAATYVPVDATVGFKASPISGLWVNLFGGYQIRDNELFSSLSYGRQFAYTGFLQDKAKIGYGGAEVKYGYKDYFDASLKGTYYSWKIDGNNDGISQDVVMAMKPEMELNFRTDVKVFEGLKINFGYDYVKRKGEGVDPVSNLYVGADYEFLKNLSIFANVNNLLNKQYYYEGGYPAEKLNLLAGFSFRF